MSQQFYTKKVYCMNCSFTGDVKIPKGQFIDETRCPKCGCIDLRKEFWEVCGISLMVGDGDSGIDNGVVTIRGIFN